MGQLKRFYRHISTLGAEVGTSPLRGPGFEKVPAHFLVTLQIDEDDAAASALDLSFGYIAVPVVELARIG